eukprot:sb/3465848/
MCFLLPGYTPRSAHNCYKTTKTTVSGMKITSEQTVDITKSLELTCTVSGFYTIPDAIVWSVSGTFSQSTFLEKLERISIGQQETTIIHKLTMSHGTLTSNGITLNPDSTVTLRCDVEYSGENLYSGYEEISISKIATHNGATEVNETYGTVTTTPDVEKYEVVSKLELANCNDPATYTCKMSYNNEENKMESSPSYTVFTLQAIGMEIRYYKGASATFTCIAEPLTNSYFEWFKVQGSNTESLGVENPDSDGDGRKTSIKVVKFENMTVSISPTPRFFLAEDTLTMTCTVTGHFFQQFLVQVVVLSGTEVTWNNVTENPGIEDNFQNSLSYTIENEDTDLHYGCVVWPGNTPLGYTSGKSVSVSKVSPS